MPWPVKKAPEPPQQARRAESDDDRDTVTQFVFFIRHGESRWNRAQASNNLYGMWSENDHGLTDTGREQAERLCAQIASARTLLKEGRRTWDADYLKRLVAPDVIYTSPFTRAVETAVIALKDLLVCDRHELTVIKEAREQRNSILSSDSSGIAAGELIRQRVQEEVTELYQHVDNKTLAPNLHEVNLNLSEVQDEWWSCSADTEEETHERRASLLRRLQEHGRDRSLIVVGHSHFFKEIFKAQLSQRAMSSFPDIAASLREQNIPPGGIVGMKLAWPRNGSVQEKCIVEAVPLLNTALTPASSSEGMLRTCHRNPLSCTGTGTNAAKGESSSCVIV